MEKYNLFFFSFSFKLNFLPSNFHPKLPTAEWWTELVESCLRKLYYYYKL